MGINKLPNIELYWIKDVVFHNTFISSIMTRDRFIQIFYNLHLADNSLEPKREAIEFGIFVIQSLVIYSTIKFIEEKRKSVEKKHL